jgi:hypothetical protein
VAYLDVRPSHSVDLGTRHACAAIASRLRQNPGAVGPAATQPTVSQPF